MRCFCHEQMKGSIFKMSSEGPQQPMLVAGLTQSKKLIKVGMASSAFIAKDADAKIINLVAKNNMPHLDDHADFSTHFKGCTRL